MKVTIPAAIKCGVPYLVWLSVWPISYFAMYGMDKETHFWMACIGGGMITIITSIAYINEIVDGKDHRGY